MNALIDDFIKDDVIRARQREGLSWMREIVEIEEIERNPFLSLDINYVSPSKSPSSNIANDVFLTPCREMKVTFQSYAPPLNLLTQNATISAKLAPRKKTQSANSDFKSAFEDRLYSNLNNNNNNNTMKDDKHSKSSKTTSSVVHMRFVTFQFQSMLVPFALLEPVICTTFIYSKKHKTVVSDMWNFVPSNSMSFFEEINISINSPSLVSFQTDPKVAKNSLIIIILSHPLQNDNGANVIKHYLNPSQTNAAAASKTVKQAFSKNNKTFSTFAWTFIDFPYNIESNVVTFPNPYLTDKPLIEYEIDDMIADAGKKVFKQIPLSISFSIESNFSPFIIRPIGSFRVQPLLSPIHQLSIHLQQIKLSGMSSRNIMISVSLKDSPKGQPISAIRSKYCPIEKVETEYSRCHYHEKNPKFDDFFLIDLPYPLQPESCLFFEIFKIHIKNSEKKVIDSIATASFPLVHKENFISDDIYNINLNFVNSKENDKNNKLTFLTLLRSNVITNDKKYREFLRLSQTPNISPQLLDIVKNISPRTLASNLMIIIDTLMTIYEKSEKFYFDPFILIAQTIESVMDSQTFEKFLIFYFHYFAFRNKPSNESSLISLSPTQINSNDVFFNDLSISGASSLSKSQNLDFMSGNSKSSAHLSLQDDISSQYGSFIEQQDLGPIAAPSSHPGFAMIDFDNDELFNSMNGPNDFQADINTSNTNTNSNTNANPDQNNKNTKNNNSDSKKKERNISKNSKNTSSKNANSKSGNSKNVNKLSNTVKGNVKFVESKPIFERGRMRRPSSVNNLAKESSKTPLHMKIIACWINFIEKNEEKGIDMMLPLLDFFFLLIVKSIAITKDREVGQEFEKFTQLWSKCASKSNNVEKTTHIYSMFVDMLFDIGIATAAAVANKSFIENNSVENIISYVRIAYSPVLFLYSVNYIDIFRESLLYLFKMSFNITHCERMQPIFALLNHLCTFYDVEKKTVIASKLLPSLFHLKPSQLPSINDIIPFVDFFNFVLAHCDEESVRKAIINDSSEKPLLNHVHFLLVKLSANNMNSTIRQKSSPIPPIQLVGNQVNTLANEGDKFKSLSKPQIKIPSSSRPRFDTMKVKRNNTTIDNISNINVNSSSNNSAVNNSSNSNNSSTPSMKVVNIISQDPNTNNNITNSNNSGNKLNDMPSKLVQIKKKKNRKSSQDSGVYLDEEYTQKALFRFVSTLLKCADFKVATGVIGIAYHAIEIVGLSSEYVPRIYEIISSVIERFSPDILYIRGPCFTQVIFHIFKASLLSNQHHKEMSTPIFTLFTYDLLKNKTNNRSLAICTRALSLMHHSQLTLDMFSEFMCNFQNAENAALLSFYQTFERLKKISQDLSIPKLSSPQKAELLLKRFIEFRNSPDAQISILNDLKKHQLEQKNVVEAMSITVLEASIIYEYLIRLKRMPNYYRSLMNSGERVSNDHFTTLVSGESPFPDQYFIGSYSMCPIAYQTDLPINLPTFCDSEMFNELGFISLLMNLLTNPENYNYPVFTCAVLDFAWPLFESRRLYGQINDIFGKYSALFAKETQNPEMAKIDLNDRYFRVAFYGQIFDENENGKTYIYRSKPMTTLFDQQKQLTQTYESLLGEKRIEIIGESGKVDQTKLDVSKGYIQVTKVEPADLENNTFQHKVFFFDKPFVMGTDKAQGTLENQCIRRTLLTVATQMPFLIERSVVVDMKSIEFDPMTVSYRQLKERIQLVQEALDQRDPRQIQQLLCGSLLVQVNEGPLKIAEIFLSGNSSSSAKVSNISSTTNGCSETTHIFDNDTLKTKLRNAFITFVNELQVGVKIHGEWVTTNTDFVALQVQLESGLEMFIEKLKPFLTNEISAKLIS